MNHSHAFSLLKELIKYLKKQPINSKFAYIRKILLLAASGFLLWIWSSDKNDSNDKLKVHKYRCQSLPDTGEFAF